MALWMLPPFDRGALIAALRTDQAGKSTFPEFLASSWQAGVIRYEVDFAARTVSYYGSNGEEYVEAYPGVEVTFRRRDSSSAITGPGRRCSWTLSSAAIHSQHLIRTNRAEGRGK